MDVMIYGGGFLGCQMFRLIKDYFADNYNVLGFIDDYKSKGTPVVNDLLVLGSLENVRRIREYSPIKAKLLFAIGYSNMKGREDAFLRAKQANYSFEKLIHPQALVALSANLGEGVIVTCGAIIDQSVSIGNVNYLDIGVRIGENCVIGSNNYFSNSATIAGYVRIGDGNFFGLNCTVVNNIIIGNNNFINAASLVYKNVEDNKKLVEVRQQRSIGN